MSVYNYMDTDGFSGCLINSMNSEIKHGLPLSSYRVLDLTTVDGYFCGKILADLGAEVIKIESPQEISGRSIGPFYKNIPDANKSLYFWAFNSNKKSITLNIKIEEGRQILQKLVRSADFLIESFAPGYLDGLGLGYPALRKINPGLIMVAITPFGQDGPRKDWKGSDIVLMSMGGLAQITGNPDKPPTRVSVDQAHIVSSVHAAMGAMIALYNRGITGKGQHVDLSMQQSAVISALTVPQAWDLQKFIWPREGAFLSRSGKRVRYLWPCKDGYVSWRIFGGGLGVKTRALVEWMQIEGQAGDLSDIDWLKMDYLSVPPDQFYHWQDIFGAFFKQHTKAELCEEALKRGVVLMAASTPEDLLRDHQLESRGFWKTIEHEEIGEKVIYPGPLFHSSEIDWQFHRAPLLGEQNDDIFRNELNYSEEDIFLLRQSGVI